MSKRLGEMLAKKGREGLAAVNVTLASLATCVLVRGVLAACGGWAGTGSFTRYGGTVACSSSKHVVSQHVVSILIRPA